MSIGRNLHLVGRACHCIVFASGVDFGVGENGARLPTCAIPQAGPVIVAGPGRAARIGSTSSTLGDQVVFRARAVSAVGRGRAMLFRQAFGVFGRQSSLAIGRLCLRAGRPCPALGPWASAAGLRGNDRGW